MPAAQWRAVAGRVRAAIREDRSSLLAAGVAFYAFLAAAPGLAAAVALYGIVADPGDVDGHLRTAFAVLPDGARGVLSSQLAAVAAEPSRSLGPSFAAALAVSIWSASRGIGQLIEAMRAVHGTPPPPAAPGRLLSYAVTAVTILGAICALAAVSALPGRFPAGPVRLVVQVTLWIGGAALVLCWLELLDRAARWGEHERSRPTTPGSIVALVLLLVALAAMNLYVATIGSFAVYGALAGVIVLLLWLHLASLIVLVGAHVNADLGRFHRMD